MPQYIFRNKKTNKLKEVFFHMTDAKVYNGENEKENGLWERVYDIPQSNVDTKIDPDDPKDFVEKTRNKKGNLGNIIDASKELSLKREQKLGCEDPVKKEYWEKWSKDRGGRKPPSLATHISI